VIRLSILERLQDHAKHFSGLSWRGSFSEYLDMVRDDPRIARLSHARLYDMIFSAGVVRNDAETPHYKFFDGKLFGIDKELAEIMEYYSAAARRLDVRKRILMLIGPPGSGKSSLSIILKRGLETYTKTDAGRLYGIVGCPMHEEPLHLIPHELREEVSKELGVVIEGELCPLCRFRYDEVGGDPASFEVERVVFSEASRIGLGTFAPNDEKSLDASMLTGSFDLSKISKYGSESDPRAFRFDGEFNISNRGLMEMQELLKIPRAYLALLLSLAQEQQIKTGRYAMIYADESVLGHSNLAEYEQFLSNPENAAIRNRVYLVKVPYALDVRDEKRIYEEMLSYGELRETHIAPNTLEIASQYAVLSRLTEPKDKGLSKMDKLKLYRGDRIKEYVDYQVDDLKKSSPNEGLSGLSPRDTMNVMTHAIGMTGASCINPLDILRSYRYFVEAGKFLNFVKEEDKKELLDAVDLVRREYDEMVKEVVMEAFVSGFPEAAQALFQGYLDEAEASLSKEKLRDVITGEERDPNEEFLRKIEEQIGVSESSARSFREEIMVRVGAITRRGGTLKWDSHPRLEEAIRKRIFLDTRHLVRVATTTQVPDKEQQKKLDAATEALIARGYCKECAKAVLGYAGSLLSRA